jgi:hypothetical protein
MPKLEHKWRMRFTEKTAEDLSYAGYCTTVPGRLWLLHRICCSIHHETMHPGVFRTHESVPDIFKHTQTTVYGITTTLIVLRCKSYSYRSPLQILRHFKWDCSRFQGSFRGFQGPRSQIRPPLSPNPSYILLVPWGRVQARSRTLFRKCLPF